MATTNCSKWFVYNNFLAWSATRCSFFLTIITEKTSANHRAFHVSNSKHSNLGEAKIIVGLADKIVLVGKRDNNTQKSVITSFSMRTSLFYIKHASEWICLCYYCNTVLLLHFMATSQMGTWNELRALKLRSFFSVVIT